MASGNHRADAARSSNRRALRRVAQGLLLAGALGLMACGLQGCFVIAAGAVVGGSYAATDRRSVGAQADDQVIMSHGNEQIETELGDAAHVNVTAFNHQVLLTGEVPSDAAKARAGEIVQHLESVTVVVNDLIVAGPSSFTSRSSDALITTRVKSQFVNTQDVFANAFKVVTERGTVYLMGRVTPREGDYGASIASSSPGVLAVVKVFDYISDEDLQHMRTQAAPSP